MLKSITVEGIHDQEDGGAIIDLDMPTDIHDIFMIIAEDRGMTIEELVNDIIREYIKETEECLNTPNKST